MNIGIFRPGKWFGSYKHFDGDDVEEHVDFHNVKMGTLGFKIFQTTMLKNMSIFTVKIEG